MSVFDDQTTVEDLTHAACQAELRKARARVAVAERDRDRLWAERDKVYARVEELEEQLNTKYWEGIRKENSRLFDRARRAETRVDEVERQVLDLVVERGGLQEQVEKLMQGRDWLGRALDEMIARCLFCPSDDGLGCPGGVADTELCGTDQVAQCWRDHYLEMAREAKR